MSRTIIALVALLWSQLAGARASHGGDARFTELRGHPAPSSLQARIDSASDGATVEIPPGQYRGTLLIEGRRGLTLRATAGTVSLVSDNTEADIVLIRRSSKIAMEGLALAHEAFAHGSGDTLTVRESQEVTVRDCDVTGGVDGVSVSESRGLMIERSYVHACTSSGVRLTGVDGINLTRNLFRAIEGGCVAISAPRGLVRIEHNTLVDNAAQLITLEGGDRHQPAPQVEVAIRRNVFAANAVPGRGVDTPWAAIFDASNPSYNHPLMKRARIEGNCFEDWRFSAEQVSHFSPGGKATGNYVRAVVLGADHRVVDPAGCADRGYRPFAWLPAAAKVIDARGPVHSPMRGLRNILDAGRASDLLEDGLMPIGFSRKGHFGYFVESADEAVGQYLWSLNILDLASDRVVHQRSWDQYNIDDEKPAMGALLDGLDGVLRYRGGDLLSDLRRFGIEAGGKAGLSRFPLVRDGDTYAVRIETTVDKKKEVERHTFVLHSSQRGRKTIGSLESPIDPVYSMRGFRVLGFLASPFTPHIVVVVTYVRSGWEGPPNVGTFALYGAHLEKRFER